MLRQYLRRVRSARETMWSKRIFVPSGPLAQKPSPPCPLVRLTPQEKYQLSRVTSFGVATPAGTGILFAAVGSRNSTGRSAPSGERKFTPLQNSHENHAVPMFALRGANSSRLSGAEQRLSTSPAGKSGSMPPTVQP